MGEKTRGSRYYPLGMLHASIIRRLLMFGTRDEMNDVRRDLTAGSINGVGYVDEGREETDIMDVETGILELNESARHPQNE